MVYLSRIVFIQQNSNQVNFKKVSKYIKKDKRLILLNKLKFMTILFFVILLSGGYNSSTYSGLYCEAFPGCHEGSVLSFSLSGMDVSFISGIKDHFLPYTPLEYQGRFLPEFKKEWINMIHRFIAVFGGTILIAMAWFWIYKKYGYNLIGKSIVSLLFFEILLGIFNVLFG